MSDTYRFEVHGSSVIPEQTQELTGQDRGLFLRPTGIGATVRQRSGTENWFHFTIPTPTYLDDWSSYLRDFWLKLGVNRMATITDILVRSEPKNGQTAEHFNLRKDRDGEQISAFEGTKTFDLRDVRLSGPVIICVHVEFDGDGGEVTFRGAGASFEEMS